MKPIELRRAGETKSRERWHLRRMRAAQMEKEEEEGLRILESCSKGNVLISLRGELRQQDGQTLFEKACSHYENGAKQVILDFSELRYCDSAGLESLVQIYKYVRERDGLALKIYTGEGPIVEIFKTCRFDKFLDIVKETTEFEKLFQS